MSDVYHAGPGEPITVPCLSCAMLRAEVERLTKERDEAREENKRLHANIRERAANAGVVPHVSNCPMSFATKRNAIGFTCNCPTRGRDRREMERRAPKQGVTIRHDDPHVPKRVRKGRDAVTAAGRGKHE